MHRLVRGGALSLGTSVAIQGLNVVSGVLLARVLGPAGRGELAAVLLWPGILAGVGGLSVTEGVAYFAARGTCPMPAVTATALAFTLAQALALVAVGYMLMPLLLGHYGAQAEFAGRLYLVWLPPYLLGQTGMAIMQGKLEWEALNLWRLVVTAATVAGLIALLFAHGLTVVNATWVYVTATSMGLVLSMAVIAARGWFGVRPDFGLMRSFVTYGLKTHIGNLAGQANLNLDKMAIAVLLSARDLGLYSAAVTLSSPLTLVGSSVAIVALPAVAGAASRLEMKEQFAWFLRSTLVLSAVTTLVLELLAPSIVQLFFGAAFLPAVVVAQVSITAAMVRCMIWVLGHGLNAFNKPLVPSIAEVLAVVTTVFGLIVLLPSMGLVGAAVTSLLAYSTSAGYMVWFAKTRLGIRLSDLLVPKPADLAVWARCVRR